MDISDITLIKSSKKVKVNSIFKTNSISLTLEDEVYLGVDYKHVWKCSCGDTFIKTFKNIKKYKCIKCNNCKNKIKNNKDKEYQFIKSVSLKKYSNKEDVNILLQEKLYLKDEIYLGASHNHTWICGCGGEFKRRFNTIKKYKSLRCPNCVNGVKDKYENLRDVHISKNMSQKDINNLISKWLTLEDAVYLGNTHKHKWMCKCGNVFERTWGAIKIQNQINCSDCHNKNYRISHKDHVEKINNYKYMDSYFKGDVLPDGNIAKNATLKIKHLYCDNVFYMRATSFINDMQRCPNCCQTYENSFAYHIEKELGEPLEKYWDFEKNTVNPYHIWKSGSEYVWMKCTSESKNKINNFIKRDYHYSYKVKCNNFFHGYRCNYCTPSSGNPRTHPYDSFGYKHFDKVMSWHPDNDISPFKVAPGSNKKYKFICETCNHIWSVRLSDVNNGQWCPKCSRSKGEKKIGECLMKIGVNFVEQKTFTGLLGTGGGLLSYDFYLPKYNLLIEYQGLQHEKFIKGFHVSKEDFYKQQEHDKRKREYAKHNNIKLLEIWYKDFDSIDDIVSKQIN